MGWLAWCYAVYVNGKTTEEPKVRDLFPLTLQPPCLTSQTFPDGPLFFEPETTAGPFGLPLFTNPFYFIFCFSYQVQNGSGVRPNRVSCGYHSLGCCKLIAFCVTNPQRPEHYLGQKPEVTCRQKHLFLSLCPFFLFFSSLCPILTSVRRGTPAIVPPAAVLCSSTSAWPSWDCRRCFT